MRSAKSRSIYALLAVYIAITLGYQILMAKLNRLVYDSSAVNRYATFFFAIFTPFTQELHFVNAGHNPIFIVRGDGDTG